MGFALEEFGYSTKLRTTTCCQCGTPFAMEGFLYKQRLEDHDRFYCPNGHAQHFTGKSEVEQLKEKISEGAKRYCEELTKRLEAERELSRIKTRVGNGICPCCQRSFSNLHRHMLTKHPEYKKKSPTVIG